MERKLVIKTDVIETKYLAFKEKENTELEKAEKAAKETAEKLCWNDINTKQLVDYVVDKAKAKLADEKAFWEEIVEEQIVEDEVCEEASEYESVDEIAPLVQATTL